MHKYNVFVFIGVLPEAHVFPNPFHPVIFYTLILFPHNLARVKNNSSLAAIEVVFWNSRISQTGGVVLRTISCAFLDCSVY